MSKSSSCFPSIKCLNKSKSYSQVKIRSTLRMPTMREFIYSHNSAGTQTSIHDSEGPKVCENTSVASKIVTPLSHRSTIAIRHDESFIPLFNFQKKPNEIPKQSSPNVSALAKHSLETSRSNNTLFMSRGSFDAIFFNMQLKEEKKEEKKEEIKEEIKEEKKIEKIEKIIEKLENPFVMHNNRMPRIIPITPAKRKRSANSRPLIRMNFRPILPNITDIDYFHESGSSKFTIGESAGSMV